MMDNIDKIVLVFGTVAILSVVTYSEEVAKGDLHEAVHPASMAFTRIAKIKDTVLRVEELSVDIRRMKTDLELMPGYCMTNQCESIYRIDRETKLQIDREYKYLKAKLYDVGKNLDEIEARMENYGNVLMGELLRLKIENGELVNGKEYMGWTALDFVDVTNKTSEIQERVAYPFGRGCPSVTVELLQGYCCFSWYNEAGKSTLYKADTNQSHAVMLKLWFEKGKPSGFMTRPFEKWRWNQFKKSDLKDGECYVVLDGGIIFVNKASD